MSCRRPIFVAAAILLAGCARAAIAAEPTPEQLDFFERRIRPLLVQRCYECHSADSKKLGGGLLLDSRAGIAKGGDTEPAIVPGDPDTSLLIIAVRHADESLKMPPQKKLSAQEIADLETWVRQGAPDPRAADTTGTLKKYAIDWEQGRAFWSLQPLSPAVPPEVGDAAWPANDIDRFVLARLEAAGLAPAALADRRTLIRRVTYDLHGLPPTPEEIDAFLADESPDAYATLVDRLLASPHYGERFGRHWLDVVRYADTAGDNSDFPIPQMHKYRDWVIDSLNRDMSYDQFVREQIAGDLLPAGSVEEKYSRIIATGYIANSRRFGSGSGEYPQHLTIEDTIDNLGRAFLGMSLSCARCHDHKFDPVSTQDYYGLYGIFHSTRYPFPGIELEPGPRDFVPLAPPEEAEAAIRAKKELKEKLIAEVERIKKMRDAVEGPERNKLAQAFKKAKEAAAKAALAPLPFDQAYAVADAKKIEDVYVQQKGDPAKPGPMVRRRFLTVMGGHELPPDVPSSGRVQLADWIVDPWNPLTARVLVNRVWMTHFGKGLVPTPNDFGKQGKPPSHPELLDWLARQFIASGWSIKSLHRQIVLSRTYQLSSQAGEAGATRDPNNDLLSHYPARRLDAESIRDTLLALGGNLDLRRPGAHPFPPQTEWRYTQHNPFKAVYDNSHRSVYLMTQRIQRHPYLAIFDGADPAASTALRVTSTTPLQALYLLNDPFVHDQARAFAQRLLKERGNETSRIDRAYRLALGRAPEPHELAACWSFLAAVRVELQSSGIAVDEIEQQTYDAFARSIFRLNEFVYVD